jgi:hypothetical protein
MKQLLKNVMIAVLILAAMACRLPFAKTTPAPDVDVVTDVPQPESTELESAEAESGEADSDTEPTAEDVVEAPPAEESATAAPSPTASPKVYAENGIEITLPDTFVMGDVETDLAILMEGLQTLGEEEADDIEALYEANKDDIILWGFDLNSPITHQTSVLVLKNEEFAGLSLAMAMSLANVLVGEEVDTLQQELLTLGGREVARFLTTTEEAGVPTAQAIYLLNESGKLWVIGFFTTQNQIDERLPTFDAAAASFKVISVE